MRVRFSYRNHNIYSAKCRNGQSVEGGRGRGKGEGGASARLRKLHTLAVYDKFRIVTVRSHEYCLVLYLVLGPFRFAVDDFEQLFVHQSRKGTRTGGEQEQTRDITNRVGDAICKSHKVEVIAFSLPVRSEREDQS